MNRYLQQAMSFADKRKIFYRNRIRTKSMYADRYQSRLAHIYKEIIPQKSIVLELGCSDGKLLMSLKPGIGVGVDFCPQTFSSSCESSLDLQFILSDVHDLDLGDQKFDYIIASDLVNDLWDVQKMLSGLHAYCGPNTRIIFNFHSQLWSVPLKIAGKLGLAKRQLHQNWLTVHDMNNLLQISGYESLRSWSEILYVGRVPLLASFFNRFLVKLPVFKHFAITNFIVSRPLYHLKDMEALSVSIIIPARNESGHIEEILKRIPKIGDSYPEIIFVEGNSHDQTYKVIEECIEHYPELRCRLMKQSGRGKGDAVRMGFEAATGDVLMILDADITVPPEDLTRFYQLISGGKAEFINGVRLVYPMDDNAMRPLNLIGNKFFSYAFSWLLGQPIRDTLCGTKVLRRSDYLRISQNRFYFGDFDLLFGAAKLNLKIMEVPVRYRARVYGETNISRWVHGWLLLKMVIFAARRIKFI